MTTEVEDSGANRWSCTKADVELVWCEIWLVRLTSTSFSGLQTVFSVGEEASQPDMKGNAQFPGEGSIIHGRVILGGVQGAGRHDPLLRLGSVCGSVNWE